MAVSNEDLARLVVTLDADVTKMYNGLRKAQQVTNTAATGIEKRLLSMSSRIDKTFANLGQRMSANLTGPLLGIGAAFSTREIIKYADAWTVAANKVAAAGDIVGIQARPLEQLRELADEGRSSFEDTIQLYSRMLRSAGKVANGELEIARATNIVNKAFKAGGAATSEMQAGILQLSQGLSSGILQGDELRSVRENAPVLAQVMADYFNTTIGGLKELGSQGKLTSEEVFKAILSGEAKIESAFGKTNRTIAESIQLVENRLIQYIGTADQTAGATATITTALTALADNFEQVADVVLKLAAIIAGALIGRSILGMVAGISQSVVVLRTLSAVMKEATSSSAKFGTALSAAFGPLALIIGGVAALAFQELSSQSLEAAASIAATNSRVEQLGGATVKTAKSIRDAALALGDQTEATKKLAEAERLRNLAKANYDDDVLRNGTFLDNAAATAPIFATDASELKSAIAVYQRAKSELDAVFKPTDDDKKIYDEIALLSKGLQEATIPAQAVIDRIREIQNEPMSESALELLDTLDRIAISFKNVEFVKKIELDTSELDSYNQKIADALAKQAELAFFSQDFALNEDINNLIDKLEAGDLTAEETKAELDRLAATNGDFSNFLSGISNLINGLFKATEQARSLKLLVDSLSSNTSVPSGGLVGGEVAADNAAGKAYRERLAAGQKYLDQQNDLLTKTEAERDLIDEIARIRKEMGDDSVLSESEITDLAAKRLAQKAADKEAKKTGTSDSEKFLEDLSKEERTNELLREELILRQSLNPFIEDYGYALERAKIEQELLNDAVDANIELTPELRDRIAEVAEVQASLNAKIKETDAVTEKLKATTQEWADFTKEATRSFIDDLIEGKTAAEAFGNVLKQIGSKLIDLGLNSIFDTSGSVGGGIGSFISKLFTPRANGGPVTAGQSYIVGEKRPEIFVPNQNGMIIPKVPNSISSNSGGINTPIHISIDATGADSAGLARVQTEIVKMKSELPYIIRDQVSKRGKKGW